MSSTTDIQEKIAAARREAETLKEKIRAKREQLADTSRESSLPSFGELQGGAQLDRQCHMLVAVEVHRPSTHATAHE